MRHFKAKSTDCESYQVIDFSVLVGLHLPIVFMNACQKSLECHWENDMEPIDSEESYGLNKFCSGKVKKEERE